jgi:hypothetical protein
VPDFRYTVYIETVADSATKKKKIERNNIMTALRKAFDIPGVDYKKEALARHLNINSDEPAELAKIEDLGVVGDNVYALKFEEQLYLVASNLKSLKGDAAVCFNGGVWSIKAVAELPVAP